MFIESCERFTGIKTYGNELLKIFLQIFYHPVSSGFSYNYF